METNPLAANTFLVLWDGASNLVEPVSQPGPTAGPWDPRHRLGQALLSPPASCLPARR